MSGVLSCPIIGPWLETLESRCLFSGFEAHIAFQPANVPVPDGYVADSGGVFGDRGNGLTYGWNGKLPAAVRYHYGPKLHGSDSRYDSFALLNRTGRGSEWDIVVPNGNYIVHIVAGDPFVASAVYGVDAEGVQVLAGKATPKQRWVEGTATVTVSNGKLTITAGLKASGTRIDFIDITQILPVIDPVSPPPPTSPPPASPPPASPPPAPLSWQAVASNPVAMAEGQGVTVDGKLYVFGGYSVTDPSWQANNQLEVYDPSSNTWQSLAPVPSQLSEAAVATDGTFIYVAGGYVTNANGQQTFATANVWRYDTVNNVWTSFVSLPAPRAVGAMVDLNGELHYFGGSDINRNDVTNHWVLNLADANPQWTASTPMPVGINRFGAVVLDGKIYAVGGQVGYDNNAVPQAGVFVWDPQNPSAWTTAASMPEAHSHLGAAVTTVGNEIIVAGGDSSVGVFLDNVVAYDPTSDTWSELTPLPEPRLAVVAASFGNQIIVSDGYDGSMTSTTWESSVLTS